MLTLCVAAVGLLSCFGLDNNDTWWHLASARWILENGGFPTADPFSHLLDGAPWIDEYWLFQILLLGVWRLGGEAAVVLLKAIWVAGLAGAAGVLLRRRGVPLWLFALLLVPAAMGWSNRLLVRPELVTWAMLLVWLFALPGGKEPPSRGALVALPLLQVVWTNAHPAFLLGPGLVVLFWLGQAANFFLSRSKPGGESVRLLHKRYGILLGATLLATVVNPYGPRLLLLPFQVTGTEEYAATIFEWQGPWEVGNPAMKVATAVLLALAGAALLLASWQRAFTRALLVAAFGWLALGAARHTALLGWIVLLAGSETFAGAWNRLSDEARARQGRRIAWAAAGVWAMVFALAATGWFWWLMYMPHRRPGLRAAAWRFPHEAAAFVREHPPEGRGLNDYNIGGFLIWELFPAKQVAIDSRLVPYPGALVHEVHEVVNGREPWRPFFEKHDIRWALLDVQAEALIRHLWKAEEWRLVFLGLRGVVFVEEPGPNRALAEEFGLRAADLDSLAEMEHAGRGPVWMPRPLPFAAYRRARLLAIFDRPDLAVRVTDAALEGLPGSELLAEGLPTYLIEAGRYYTAQENWVAAERTLRRLIEMEPRRVDAWNNLGVVFARSGRLEPAEEAWEQALRLDPGNAAIQRNLSTLRAKME